MTPCLLMLAMAPPEPAWFGPVTLEVPVRHQGNPYDPAQNDLLVTFTSSAGDSQKRIGYFDGKAWKVTLSAPRAGNYKVAASFNGKPVDAQIPPVQLRTRAKHGFARRSGERGFVADGKSFWPIGFNLAWKSGDWTYPEVLQRMGKAGLNWSRIWTNHWDGKNPYWPMEKKLPRGYMDPEVFGRWDEIVAAAEENDVRFQWVLFHHGPWSSTVNSNWGENPWNVANGGWLKTPGEFFTDPLAKSLAKNWLRYAVARYGHSPAVFAWELFNEVEWCDPSTSNPEVVGKWHDEMARYLREIDPYRHLITTSSRESLPIWKEMDVIEPHGYPPSVAAMLYSATIPADKPMFFGEVGPGDFGGPADVQKKAIRDGVWAALLAGHSGAGQYWSWDEVVRRDLFGEYARATQILPHVRREGKTFLPKLRAELGGDLVLAPGGGWAPTTRFEYDLPGDAATQMGHLSTYFQGRAHPEMREKDVTFRFQAPKAGVFRVVLVGAASGGGSLTIRVNGRDAAVADIAANQANQRLVLEAPFSAGAVEITLANEGPDWVQLSQITVSGIAPKISGVGRGDPQTAVMRLSNAPGVDTKQIVGLGGLPLEDGPALVRIYDLDSDASVSVEGRVRSGGLEPDVEMPGKDCIITLARK